MKGPNNNNTTTTIRSHFVLSKHLNRDQNDSTAIGSLPCIQMTWDKHRFDSWHPIWYPKTSECRIRSNPLTLLHVAQSTSPQKSPLKYGPVTTTTKNQSQNETAKQKCHEAILFITIKTSMWVRDIT